MSIKLFSLAKDFNIGINTLAEKLQEKGFSDVTANPNTRIGKEEFDCLSREFGKEVPLATMEKLRRKFDPKTPSTETPTDEARGKVDAPQPKKATIEIPTEVPESLKPGLTIVGEIKDLIPETPTKEPKTTAPSSEEAPVKEEKKIVEETKAEAKKAKASDSQPEPSTISAPTTQESKLAAPTATSTKKELDIPSPDSSTVAKERKTTAKDIKTESPSPIAPPKGVDANQDTSKIKKPSSNNPEASESRKKTAGREMPKDPRPKVTAEAKDSRQSTSAPATKGMSADKTDKPHPHKEEAKPEAETPATASNKDEIFRPGGKLPEMAIKVVGSIDLASINSSTRPSRKTKEERNKERNKAVKGTTGERSGRRRISGQAIDVKAEGAKITENRSSDNSRRGGDRNNNQARGRNNTHGGGNNPRRQPVRAEVKDEDVQKQVKETLARLTSKKSTVVKGAKYRKDKREAASRAAHDAREQEDLESKTLKLTEFVTVSDLANMMDVPVNEVIATCMSIGLMVSINMRLDAETINLVTEEFGFETEFVSADVVESIQSEEEEDDAADLMSRPPIVTVMGHVDHGKTSLLDNIRKTNVIAGEAGGITQHIGAYNLKLQSGRHITFLDTPGHEAFTAMRARGAKVTDIAIIIIAADDSVMPQTKEAINHAAAAGVPMVFAINKIDKPGANTEKIREELAGMNYLVEDWGGKYQCQEISAKQGIGISDLLEKVLLEADMLELKANPKRRAVGSIIESSLDKGRGYVATVLVQNGTLNMGDVVLAGTNQGRIKAMFNERNMRVKQAGPSEPVLILGLDGAPAAGDIFHVLDSEQEARSIANKREQLQREQNDRTRQMLTLDILARRREIGNFQELNVIVKGDVDGSVEALADSLIKLSAEEIQVNVIHKGVGQVSESDVVLAAASSAVIIGFQVRPSVAARKLSDQEGIEIRTYSIIYDAIEDVKSAMEGMLSPEIREEVSGTLTVMQAFKITKVGTIAGCMVNEGKVRRTSKVRLIRDGIVVFTGKLGSLKRFKDDAKEVVAGLDCGLNIDGFNDVREGDMIEAYDEIEIKKTL